MTYALLLNDMRSSNIENIVTVRVDEDRAVLVRWYESQLAPESYRDGTWLKVFMQGSELEWMNPAHDLTTDNNYWGGIWTVPSDTPIGLGLYKRQQGGSFNA